MNPRAFFLRRKAIMATAAFPVLLALSASHALRPRRMVGTHGSCVGYWQRTRLYVIIR